MLPGAVVIAAAVCVWRASVTADNASETFYTTLLDDLLRDYNKFMRPHPMDNSTVVTIDYFLRSLQLDDDGLMTIDGYLRQKWHDPRLSVKRLVYRRTLLAQRNAGGFKKLRRSHARSLQKLFGKAFDRPATLNWLIVSDIWRPDTVFLGDVHGQVHNVTVPNRLIRIYWDGDVFLSQRVRVTLHCHFVFRYFPMDTQTCSVRLFSFAFDDNDLKYEWSSRASKTSLLSPDITLAQFHVEDAWVYTKTMHLNRHDKSVAVLQLRVHRHIGYYVLSTYLPCIALVMLTTLNFFFSPEQISDRITLCLTCILTMTFLILEVRRSESVDALDLDKDTSDAPSAAPTPFAWLFASINVTALELYLFVSLTFLLLAVVESAWVVRYTSTWAVIMDNPGLLLSSTELLVAVAERQRRDDNVEPIYDKLLREEQTRSSWGEAASEFGYGTWPNGLNGEARWGARGGEGREMAEVGELGAERAEARSCGCLDAAQGPRGVGKRLARRRRAAAPAEAPRVLYSGIDRLVRVIYPLTFLIFNIVYWYLLNQAQLVKD